MRRSRERRVTTCDYRCMAFIDLIVSHTHMTIRMSYRDTVFVQAQPAWPWFSFVILHVCSVTGYGDLDQARRGGIGADMEQSHHWSQVQHAVTGHSYHLNTLYPAPWKSVQNSSRSLESRADLSCAMLMIAYLLARLTFQHVSTCFSQVAEVALQ